MYGSQVGRHVILSVKFLMTNFAWVRIPLKMSCYVMPMKVAWVGVGIVADLAAIGILRRSFVSAKASNTYGVGAFWGSKATSIICIEVSELRFDLFLHLKIHQVR